MSMRIGVVVQTHPGDNSVDIVMVDDGSRMVGIQVLSMNGSVRSGTVDLPNVQPAGDKWDITQAATNAMKAVVGFIGRSPVVVGFLYPQVNQMLFDDPELRINRHQSDVIQTIDGHGNIQISHPSGTYIRIGENPDRVDLSGKNNDGSLDQDRNTGRKTYVRVGLADRAAEVTMTPDGDVTFKLEKDFTVDAQGECTIKSPTKITLETPLTECTNQLKVNGLLTYAGGLVGSGGSGATAKIDGSIEATGDIKSDNISLPNHDHEERVGKPV